MAASSRRLLRLFPSSRRLLRPLLRPHQPLFPSVRPRCSLRPPCSHLSCLPSLHLSLAPPSSPPYPGDFWWLHASHAEPSSTWVRALWEEVCKGPIFTEVGRRVRGGEDRFLEQLRAVMSPEPS